MLRTRVELVTGFIGSGKTTWIELLLQETVSGDEKIVVLQLEQGQGNLTRSHKSGADITYIEDSGERLSASYLRHLIMLYEPQRLIVECNGMKALDEIMTLMEKPKIREQAFVSTIFNLVEGHSFEVYWHNLKPILYSALKESHMIVVTQTHLMTEAERITLKALLEEENTHAHILFTEDFSDLKACVKDCRLLDKGWLKDIRVKFVRELKKIHRDREERR